MEKKVPNTENGPGGYEANDSWVRGISQSNWSDDCSEVRKFAKTNQNPLPISALVITSDNFFPHWQATSARRCNAADLQPAWCPCLNKDLRRSESLADVRDENFINRQPISRCSGKNLPLRININNWTISYRHIWSLQRVMTPVFVGQRRQRSRFTPRRTSVNIVFYVNQRSNICEVHNFPVPYYNFSSWTSYKSKL